MSYLFCLPPPPRVSSLILSPLFLLYQTFLVTFLSFFNHFSVSPPTPFFKKQSSEEREIGGEEKREGDC